MILRGCDKFLQKLPVEITWRLHFTIKNSLAQLSNQSGEIKQSIKYLKDAIGIAESGTNLPLSETYLNIASAYTFLKKFHNAIIFADKAEQHSEH